MGQGLGVGLVSAGVMTAATAVPMQISMSQAALQVVGGALLGVGIDMLSDIYAKEGKVVIARDAVLHADEGLRHVYSFYSTNGVYPISRWLQQKHEWIVLESETRKFYTVQKDPATGDLRLDYSLSLRGANDNGLRVAHQPTSTGEIRLHRTDHEFDLDEELQLAYVIAWLRKEDPRWSFTTENSRHFTIKIRKALNDF